MFFVCSTFFRYDECNFSLLCHHVTGCQHFLRNNFFVRPLLPSSIPLQLQVNEVNYEIIAAKTQQCCWAHFHGWSAKRINGCGGDKVGFGWIAESGEDREGEVGRGTHFLHSVSFSSFRLHHENLPKKKIGTFLMLDYIFSWRTTSIGWLESDCGWKWMQKGNAGENVYSTLWCALLLRELAMPKYGTHFRLPEERVFNALRGIAYLPRPYNSRPE